MESKVKSCYLLSIFMKVTTVKLLNVLSYHCLFTTNYTSVQSLTDRGQYCDD